MTITLFAAAAAGIVLLFAISNIKKKRNVFDVQKNLAATSEVFSVGHRKIRK